MHPIQILNINLDLGSIIGKKSNEENIMGHFFNYMIYLMHSIFISVDVDFNDFGPLYKFNTGLIDVVV